MASGLLLRPSQTVNFRSSRHLINDALSPLHRKPGFCAQFSSTRSFKLSAIKCHPFIWIPDGRAKLLKSARSKHIRQIILNASNEELVSGAERGGNSHKNLDLERVLVIGEAVCVAAATSIFITSRIVHVSRESRLVSSTNPVSLISKSWNLPAWQNFFLLAALLINAILRARQWQGGEVNWSARNKLYGVDSSLQSRLQKLEEDLGSTVTIVRVLSKQVEKLGVRFRVTRQTLRDPIQETALLAQKTSESLNVLAAREDAFEKGLEEIQYALHGMQENQTKQLELISALGKLLKDRTNGKVEKSLKGSNVSYKGKDLTQHARQKWSDGTVNLQNARDPDKKLIGDQERVKHITSSGRTPEVNERSEAPKRVDYWLSTSDSSREGQAVDSMLHHGTESSVQDPLSNDPRSS